jgi:hypothetical protein
LFDWDGGEFIGFFEGFGFGKLNNVDVDFWGLGFGVWGLGFGVWGLGFRV